MLDKGEVDDSAEIAAGRVAISVKIYFTIEVSNKRLSLIERPTVYLQCKRGNVVLACLRVPVRGVTAADVKEEKEN